MNNRETAIQGYKQSQREKELRGTPHKPSMDKVMGVLPSAYAELLKSPPTKQETKFLSRDMETLMQDLGFADKGLQAIPQLEQGIKGIEVDMYRAMAEQQPEKYNGLASSLKNEQKILVGIQEKIADTLRGAKAYHENNPEDVAKSREMLKTLRTQLSASYEYGDAKDNLPKLTKPVVQWLDDLKDKGNIEDRLLAQKVLKQGGIDAKSLLAGAEKQRMGILDQTLIDMRAEEEAAGTASTEKPQKGAELP